MSSAIAAWRELAGDALIAVGEKVRGAGEDWPANYYEPQLTGGPARITKPQIRSALDELSDSKLLRIAAKVIAGWRPLLVRDHVAALTDVDLLIEVLRDRADQFEAVENPLLTTVRTDPK
ncbi:hypothetical protein Jolie2_33 [Mycobacterium phage Jolie2]|uniref:Uncharacterized protein n=1 Tax=Mycobacterium phage Jolie2 TaxID=1458831 RepID=W8EB12_9CAUD|nr:hypothetical protein Jolie2_33 [Mycobacterium phage Jolie2]AHJ86583.1 hypothetical protein Jolie2_33 [Mycobacterium phage Jolie2]